MEETMKKITTLTDEQYSRIKNRISLGKEIRQILNIPQTRKIGIGDTLCMIGQPTKEKEVFKYIQNGREIFYVIIEPLDSVTAMCYSLYPIGK